SFARMAAAEAARLTRLVDDLTVGFRPTAERTFPIGEALERARAVLDRLYPGDAHRLSSEGRHLLVRGDPDRVLQVVLNLVENALKYGPEGGSIRVCAEQDGTLVRVTVRDEGGPLDDYEVLFEAHRRAGRSGPGSGLGLYVVRQIVRDWGGTVWGRHSYDEPRGNEFGFSIPAAASASGGPVQGGNDARGA
ncbi:MAG TPA: ATP-binding protein, partial [Deinococcales bacterium]|nr:ATP-binding protein [Deinococcales bacterium]